MASEVVLPSCVLQAVEPAYAALQALAGIRAEESAKEEDAYRYAVDSWPVVVARRSCGMDDRVGAEFCDKCYNAAKSGVALLGKPPCL